MYKPEAFSRNGEPINMIGRLNAIHDKTSGEVTGYVLHAYEDQSVRAEAAMRKPDMDLSGVNMQPRCTPRKGMYMSTNMYEQAVEHGMHVVANPDNDNKMVSLSTTLRYNGKLDDRGFKEIVPDFGNIQGPGFYTTASITSFETMQARLAKSSDIVAKAREQVREARAQAKDKSLETLVAEVQETIVPAPSTPMTADATAAPDSGAPRGAGGGSSAPAPVAEIADDADFEL